MRRVSNSRPLVLAASLAALLFLAGTVAVPLLESVGVGGARLARLCYAPLCHQKPERSLEIGGSTQAVCARCSGLYLGGVLGLLAGAVPLLGRRPRPRWLGLWAVPTIVDALMSLAGLPSLSNVPRLLLAVPLGLVAGLFLATAIADLPAEIVEVK